MPPSQRSPMSGFRKIVDPQLARRYRQEGWWGEETIGDHLRRHAAEQANKSAYITPDTAVSFGLLDAAADLVTSALVGAGAEPGDRLAVRLPDGPAIHALFVGCERAGVTVVGIGARSGEQELRHLLTKTGARWFATHDTHRDVAQADVVESLRAAGIGLDHHLVLPSEMSAEWPLVVDGRAAERRPLSAADLAGRALGPDDLFLINSTSGTTGLPKCVTHFQNRWVYFHRKAAEHGALTGDDVFFSAVPVPFGFGLWTSHTTPLILGASTVQLDRFTTAAAIDMIERHRVTVLCCVSTQFIMLLNDPDIERRDLSSLRVMFTGGEAVPYERAVRFEETTGATVLQFYGSNETGLLSGTTLSDTPEQRLRTAGRIVEEMNVRLFDDRVDVTATGRGQPGCIGPATSVGYLDDDAANAELFTDDGHMLMADICQIDAGGYLSVVGRTSDIIIRGGKNISAAQVEDEVGSHPAVALAAAVPVPDETFGERVGVYVELRPGATLTFDDLLEHLRSRGFSRELFPEHFAVLDELPRSSGAKVAKGQLRKDAAARFGA